MTTQTARIALDVTWDPDIEDHPSEYRWICANDDNTDRHVKTFRLDVDTVEGTPS